MTRRWNFYQTAIGSNLLRRQVHKRNVGTTAKIAANTRGKSRGVWGTVHLESGVWNLVYPYSNSFAEVVWPLPSTSLMFVCRKTKSEVDLEYELRFVQEYE